MWPKKKEKKEKGIANNYLNNTAKKNVVTGRQFTVAAPKVADV